MAVIVDFTPALNSAFQFTATLDGDAYTVIVTWGFAGQRYYVNLYAGDGTRVLSEALIGSPPEFDISMTEGYFTTKLVYRAINAQFEII